MQKCDIYQLCGPVEKLQRFLFCPLIQLGIDVSIEFLKGKNGRKVISCRKKLSLIYILIVITVLLFLALALKARRKNA